MLSITRSKPIEEVLKSLSRDQKVYIIGCGTCTTIQHTGGKAEVLTMKEKLEEVGKVVTGWMVIPTACDPMAEQALAEKAKEVEAADAILAMPCSFGVQTIA
ncbi:MAG: hypothetical protein HYX85_02320, partial [Chloroflexi bacterium]|nr:hypothetical protein [Chloroflexota bacterium]